MRALVVTGGGAYETSYAVVFQGYEDLQWTIAESDEAAFATDIRDDYDVVVMYNRSDSLSQSAAENLRGFIEAGKGLVVWHHALGSYNDWEWWWRDVVGGKYQMKPTTEQPRSLHSFEQEIIVELTGSHLITDRLGPFPFHMVDETYKDLWISPDNNVVLETANSTSDGPICWVSAYRRSRVVVIVPGHGRGAHINLGFRVLMRDAMLWAARKL